MDNYDQQMNPLSQEAVVQGWYRLSAAQQSRWFMCHLNPEERGLHNIALSVRVPGAIDVDALAEALQVLAQRHPVLSAAFSDEDGVPRQRFGGDKKIAVDVIDGRDLAESELRKQMQDVCHRPFEHARSSRMHACVFLCPGGDTNLLIIFDHMAVDGWSFWKVLDELGNLLEGKPDVGGKPAKASYLDYVAWQQRWQDSPAYEAQWTYWKNYLGDDLPVLQLPADRVRDPRSARQIDTYSCVADSALTQGILGLARKQSSTPYAVLLAAYFALLHRYGGQDTVVVGCPAPGRSQAAWFEVAGDFVNPLPLVARFSETLDVASLLRQVRDSLFRGLDNQDFPFADMVERLQVSRTSDTPPLFQTTFVFQKTRSANDLAALLNADDGGPVIRWGGYEVKTSVLKKSNGARGLSDFSVEITELGGLLHCEFWYDANLFEAATVERMARHYLATLAGFVADPSQAVDRVSILSEAEHAQLVHEWNCVPTDYSSEQLVHHLFEARAAAVPDAVAIQCEGQSVSYAQLNQRANRLAHRLIALGVRPDARVAICMERSVDMLVAMLGTLKAGGAYVPLDPSYPAERLAYMLGDSNPIAILIHERSRNLLVELSLEMAVLDLDADQGQWETLSQANPSAQATGLCGSHLAYIIYTSGSTGRPKGVMVEHGNVTRLLHATDAWFHFNAQDAWSLFHSFAFDFSVWEIWGALAYGGRLVIVPLATARSTGEFYRLLCETGVTVLNQTPSAFRQLIAAQGESGLPHKLRHVIFGGEALETGMLEDWYERDINRGTGLVNMYGITETTVHVTYHPLSQADAARQGASPIGKRIPDLRLYVLDRYGQPVPVGVAGELYVGGAGVARGYFNRPELTAERFLHDPFDNAPGARMYKSGDLGRYLADGNIEYLGRNDFQVKIRGFRIELGEIEAKLLAYTGVKQAVVLARADRHGGQSLVAYLVAEADVVLDVADLRAVLTRELAAYMVPSAFVQLESLPLTSNGKLDRKALPTPNQDAYVSHGYEAPQGELEQSLATIWSDILKREQIGRHDNFFELGGHSLLAVQLLSRLRQALQIEAPLGALFNHATLSGFAASLASAERSVMNPMTPADRSRPLPLSFAQKRLWFLAQIEGQSLAYHIVGGVTLHGELNSAMLSKSLDRVVARHEALRTTFHRLEQDVVQLVGSADTGMSLRLCDLRDAGNAEDTLRRTLQEEARAPFDFERGPLIRACLLQVSHQEHVLFLAMHHVVSDAWSLGLLFKEVSALYRGYCSNGDDPLPPLGVQYADYAQWQRGWFDGERRQRQTDYWKARLAGAPDLLALTTDRPRPQRQDHAGSRCPVRLDADLCGSLHGFCRRHGITPYMALITSWALLLARLSGQDDIVIGSPVAGRAHPDTENLIGFFINTLVLRFDLRMEQTVAELIGQAKGNILDAQQNQDLPFEQLVELVQPERSAAYSPIFQVMFAWQNAQQDGLDLPGLAVTPLEIDTVTTAKFDLTLNLREGAGCITGELEYATALFEHASIERHISYWMTLLEALLADDAKEIGKLPLLDATERHRLLVEWNATQSAYPQEQCIHALFEERAAATPEALAVVFGEEQLSYAELNGRANRLAHRLIALGVVPGEAVGIALERSIELIVAELAVVKAMAVYVPLDPVLPPSRQAMMLADCQARWVIATAPVGQCRQVDPHDHSLADCSSANPDVEAAEAEAGSIAYVMYTSGSTGLPKGVEVPHRAIVRLVCNNGFLAIAAEDRMAFAANPAFDATTLEVWGPLLHGAAIVVIDQATLLEPARFAAVLQDQGVSLLWLTVGLFNQYADALAGVLPRLRTLIVGGDALDPKVINKVLRESAPQNLLNGYGPTETTTFACTYRIETVVPERSIPIGRPIGNTTVYLLDAHKQPVPIGVAGEIHIGGAGVARGYLNQAELTAERFIADPFSADPKARLYKSGDLGRYLADGNIEFLGRNDDQVKIRGFRIELGEIEAKLGALAQVREAVVLAREDQPGDKRLVAYVVAQAGVELDVTGLRAALGKDLADYMVPSAYVVLDALPLTVNGKIDRRALPVPAVEAYVNRGYEAPQGEIEIALAAIWQSLLGVPVGRHDNFFELGGHSLLAVSLIERMRETGLQADVRALFSTPTVAELATAVGIGATEVSVPPNAIPQGSTRITPAMLPLVALTQEEIDRITEAVQGGAANIQDIYPLAPLQEGILFQHLIQGKGDTYLLPNLLAFDSRERLDQFLAALREVVARHDILRTAVMWEGFEQALQVVWREAPLLVEELNLGAEAGDIGEQLQRLHDPRHYRIDIRQAPLMRGFIAEDKTNARWLLHMLSHHLAIDHTTLEIMIVEIQEIVQGRAASLPAALPFRNFVAQARLGARQEEHDRFFSDMLADIDEPTAPFGLLNVQGDGSDVAASRQAVDAALSERLRRQARALGVSAATLVHVAWAQVLSKLSGREAVVFGTVLFGRMQGGQGADRVLGMFINTLPLRLDISQQTVVQGVRQAHARLSALMRHEHASLALAQRCSAVAAPAPLFSALLNYRHTTAVEVGESGIGALSEGMQVLSSEEVTNYPVTLSVDDVGTGFLMSAHVSGHIDPARVCGYMHTALENLVAALESAPETALCDVSVLRAQERHQLLVEWNATQSAYPQEQCIHALFEERAAATPEALAVVFDEEQLSYAELNARANRLAHRLIALGVVPDSRVAICIERSADLVLAMLAVLKAGAAYVPLDPAYPADRLAFMVADSAPLAVLVHGSTRPLLQDLTGAATMLDLEADQADWAALPARNPAPQGLHAHHLAYVIYTSGSTGQPKGVMVEHTSLGNLVHWHCRSFGLAAGMRSSSTAGVAFDATTWEIWPPLCVGASLVLPPAVAAQDPEQLLSWWEDASLDVSFLVTPLAELALARGAAPHTLKHLLIGGDRLRHRPEPWPEFALVNNYGPTETTVVATSGCVRADDAVLHIGRPIGNTTVYLLDAHKQPVPIGVAGEIHIGGAGVARGYLNQAELTAERFIADPFSADPKARLYKSGDLGRYLADGNIEFLGRNDDQVKIRGFRIELGEIEAKLGALAQVREAVVLAREDQPGDKRLVAYVVAQAGAELDVAGLRAALGKDLADYMVPSAYVVLDALPLTVNGKIDRRALPVPAVEAYVNRGYEAPQGEIETALAAIWQSLLGVPVGRHDNFFELGGHSLLAIQVMSKIRDEFNLTVPLERVFASPTIATLGDCLTEAQLAQLDQFDEAELESLLARMSQEDDLSLENE